MRKLKFHEQKLLKKTNFLQWKTDNSRELEVLECTCTDECPSITQVLRRYHISDRDDYKKYNKLCGHITKLVSQLRQLDDKDATRIELTDKLLDKYVTRVESSSITHTCTDCTTWVSSPPRKALCSWKSCQWLRFAGDGCLW